MKILRGSQGSRDQGSSPFGAILLRLCDASGALGAALVDAEGETVDYAGRVDPYHLRLAAAEWRIVLSRLEDQSAAWAQAHEMWVRAGTCSFGILLLSDGYALVIVLPRFAFRVSPRALGEALEELSREAGLSTQLRPARVRWSRVEVRTAALDPKRPEAVWQAGAWCALTVLGRLETAKLELSEGAPLSRREAGYLARVASGRELLLVREPLGKWYLGDPV